MSPTRFFFATSLLLLLSHTVVSSTDYGYYAPNPEQEAPLNVPKPNLDQLKPKDDTVYPPKTDLTNFPKPEDLPIPKLNGYIPKPKLDLDKLKPNLDKQEGYGDVPKQGLGKVPELADTEKPLPICVEGLVLCKSGPKFTPIEGAVARITCNGVDENGYETALLAVYTPATDAKGYFFATLPASKFGADNLKLTECKAFVDNSPSQTCKVPTDINNGMSGALLDSFRILKDKHVKLYRVQPFVFTLEATPNGY